MVICIIALPVFALLGLFSLRYRMLAGEAFRCLFRTIQLKPCDTGLDQKIKSKFTMKLMWWPAAARFFYKQFVLLSWVFVILMILSAAFTAYGLYNYVKYGNCNGEQGGICIFNPTKYSGSAECSIIGEKGEVDVGKVNLTWAVIRGKTYAPFYIVEYGCYSCHYTKEAEGALRAVLGNYSGIKLFYLDVPLPIHSYSVEAGEAVICAGEQGKYWQYHDILFERQAEINETNLQVFARELKLNATLFNLCLNATSTKTQIEQSRKNAFAAGVYGTPTFVIGKRVLVGSQKYEDLKRAVEKEFG